ncbi:hypothetical protein GJAV_G00130370 [Gymnothorax javanicus]|nr:hypothetical protein GJAV_G00130370 [Gymnothorax javanicus]
MQLTRTLSNRVAAENLNSLRRKLRSLTHLTFFDARVCKKKKKNKGVIILQEKVNLKHCWKQGSYYDCFFETS